MKRLLLVSALLVTLVALAHSQSRVVVVWDTNAVRGATIDSLVVRSMMDAGIKALTDSTTVGQAWKGIFPGLTVSQNICIKLNCINSALSSHPQVTTSILRGLTQMQLGATTFRRWRLIGFDRSNGELTGAGYTIRTDTLGMRCTGNWGYQAKVYSIMGTNEQFSRVLGDSSAFMINLCVLKDHTGPAYTLNMKNHYGTINNPGSMAHDPTTGRRQIPELIRVIRDSLGRKEKIYIIDALFAIYDGGPGGSPQAIPRIIVLSKDPVACDSMGVEMINNLRRAHGLQPKDSRYLAYAESIGLGRRAYQLIRINNPSAVEQGPRGEDPSLGLGLLPGQPNPFSEMTEIAFLLPRAGEARVEVFNVLGARVQTLARGTFPAGRHTATWDGQSASGHPAPSGVYFIRLSFGTASIERSVSLVH